MAQLTWPWQAALCAELPACTEVLTGSSCGHPILATDRMCLMTTLCTPCLAIAWDLPAQFGLSNSLKHPHPASCTTGATILVSSSLSDTVVVLCPKLVRNTNHPLQWGLVRWSSITRVWMTVVKHMSTHSSIWGAISLRAQLPLCP